MKKIFSLCLLLWSIQFAHATITVVNGMSHEYAFEKGSKHNGEIVIKNLSKSPARVLFYKTDLMHNCNGETRFEPINAHERTSSSWVEISNNELIIGPEGEVTATYSVTVPSEGNFIGSYWSCIMVEEAEAPDTSEKKKGIRVRSLIRYAVQIAGTFAEGQEKNLDLLDPKVDTTDNGVALMVNVQNTGNTLMKPIMVLELYDDAGSLVKRIEVTTQKVYPGMCKKFEITLEGVPQGKYAGVLVADCGENDLYGLNLNVDLSPGRG